MPLTTAQLTALKAELANPAYSGLGDEACADRLNNLKDRTVDVDTLDTGLLIASIVAVDFAALNATQRLHLQLICSAPYLPMLANLRTQIATMFGAGTATRANYLAQSQRPGSRSEELKFGIVTPSDVADARRLP
jgi:hypothetical protein